MKINKSTTNANDIKKAIANNTVYVVQDPHTFS